MRLRKRTSDGGQEIPEVSSQRRESDEATGPSSDAPTYIPMKEMTIQLSGTPRPVEPAAPVRRPPASVGPIQPRYMPHALPLLIGCFTETFNLIAFEIIFEQTACPHVGPSSEESLFASLLVFKADTPAATYFQMDDAKPATDFPRAALR